MKKNLQLLQHSFWGTGKKKSFQHAQELRKEMTPAEIKLWQYLRNRNLQGIKFRRQHPFDQFILDFFAPSLFLAIELDGEYHEIKAQKEYDEGRTAFLNDRNVTILRFKNDDVLNNVSVVLISIKTTIVKLQDEKISINDNTGISPLLHGEGAGGEANVF